MTKTTAVRFQGESPRNTKTSRREDTIWYGIADTTSHLSCAATQTFPLQLESLCGKDSHEVLKKQNKKCPSDFSTFRWAFLFIQTLRTYSANAVEILRFAAIPWFKRLDIPQKGGHGIENSMLGPSNLSAPNLSTQSMTITRVPSLSAPKKQRRPTHSG